MEASQLRHSLFSREPDTKGFDLSAGQTWIYPENYPVRDYQFNIVETALYNNTLVCLPTGLGKTFIAAVVMYNFWRWYPQGKVVFLAPTRNLVSQQIRACQDMMGIPSSQIVELTGAINQKNRQMTWFKKRVIFATPQIFHNDLEKNIVPEELVKCVVIDEAHKALGKHAYCEGIRLLRVQNKYFRILGLSATPGGKMDAVHEVIKNLYISNLELRDDASPDIVPYINERKLDIILVCLSNELAKFKERYIHIMDRHVKVLIQCKILNSNTRDISKGRIFLIQKEFQEKSNRSANYGQIMKTLNILVTMYHAYELMIRHGLRAFYNFYQNHSDKFWMKAEVHLQDLLDDVKSYLGPFPDIRPLPDGTIPEVPQDLVFGHNKFHKLKELLVQHFKCFNEKNIDTRAIVFVEYRDSVNEVYVSLLQSRPLLRPQMFVGQAKQRQRQQIQALEYFKSNRTNVLISTSVGEEGLDVGEVDLIVCFDISQHSPIRLVQRMGRTGRLRDGRIIILVTDGKEHQTLKSAMAKRDSLNKQVRRSKSIESSLYKESPRMVPLQFKPNCFKMHIVMHPGTQVTTGKGKRKENQNKRKRNTSKTENKDIHVPQIIERKSGNQYSMVEFLKNNKSHKQPNEELDIIGLMTQENNSTCSTIKPDNVKLLTSDNYGIEFLTLYAMKRSMIDESRDRIKEKIAYVPDIPSDEVKNFFDNLVPDLKILDCLVTLSDKVEALSLNERENFTLSCADDNHFWSIDKYVDINDFDSMDEIINPVTKNVKESRFEDLLDDSSDSSGSIRFVNEENSNQNEILERSAFEHLLSEDSNNSKQSLIANTKPDSDASEINSEPGMFEDLLNESSNESDGQEHLRRNDIKRSPKVSSKGFNCEDGVRMQTEKYSNTNSDHLDKYEAESINFRDSRSNGICQLLSNNSNNVDDSVCINEAKLENKNSIDHLQFDRSALTITQAIEVLEQIKTKKQNSSYVNDTNEEKPNRPNNCVIDLCSTSDSNDDPNSPIKSERFLSKQFAVSEGISVSNPSVDKPKVEVNSEDDLFEIDDFTMDDDFEVDINVSDNKRLLESEEFKCTESSKKTRSEVIMCDVNDELGDNLTARDRKIEVNVDALSNSSFKSSDKDKSLRRIDNIPVKGKVEKDGDDNGWISVAKSNNTLQRFSSLIKKGKVSNARNDCTTKPCINNQSLSVGPDSDDDFVINIDDLGRLDELESKFFSKEKIANSANNNSTFNNSKRPARSLLSLKSKEVIVEPPSLMKDLSVFSAPSKYKDRGREDFKLKRDAVDRKEVNLKDNVRKRYKSKSNNEFINYEANVSIDHDTSEGSSGLDDDLADLVSYTQDIQDEATDMHAHYLQSIKSPVKRPGAFLFKNLKNPRPDWEIFSQPASQEQDASYLYDTFCVNEDDLSPGRYDPCSEYSVLEEIESALKNKKRRRNNFNDTSRKGKRRKVVTNVANGDNNSSSSEDETEILRKQILDESKLLKVKNE